MNEEDADEFLEWLEWLGEQQPETTTIIVPKKNDSTSSLHKCTPEERDKIMIEENNEIINSSNVILKERLKAKDWSLRVQDIISVKNDAFRQNQTIQGKDDDLLDNRKLIPAVINIQINN